MFDIKDTIIGQNHAMFDVWDRIYGANHVMFDVQDAMNGLNHVKFDDKDVIFGVCHPMFDVKDVIVGRNQVVFYRQNLYETISVSVGRLSFASQPSLPQGTWRIECYSNHHLDYVP